MSDRNLNRPELPKPKKPSEWRRYKEQKKEWRNQRLEKKLSKLLENEQSESLDITVTQDKIDIEKIDGRQFTISIALPSSIMRNAQSSELRTYLAGQIGRACCVFNIDEIIIFNDDNEGENETFNMTDQLVRLLEYLECPQYLRKQFFPKQKFLEYAGLLNPLDAPHHLRMNELWYYREGVTLPMPYSDGQGSLVDVGLYETKVQIDKRLQPGVRVTVQRNEKNSNRNKKKIFGEVVSPTTPRTHLGLYWGYQVRKVESIRTIFDDCPFHDDDDKQAKYDLVIGTSERGTNIDDVEYFPEFKHALIVFGGLKGIEHAIKYANKNEDETVTINDIQTQFNYYLNTCPDQGSRTIRTEEAILITLSCLRHKMLKANGKSKI
ncbi:unnamed protein product [Didymodactylos carnosus]|uniref:RNA methyltransferase n=1 Tax=Didymodactylos carnosus TaxID=1234261 RepID=A0A8S2N127_9BILA|nr:unnamed protein product [Didymodactylos carnosus]CAF3970862.1 unnamed protein product [Didymodactylos carnosus]